MNHKKTLIFVGSSGCGKGTQADLVETEFKKKGEKVTHIELGSEFRDFLSTTTFTAQSAEAVSKTGGLQPEFLAIHLWTETLNLYHKDEKNLILDGTPRTLREAHILDGALDFYNVVDPIVIYIATSDETARKRMLSRNRADDTEEKIENRLSWFNTEVMQAVDFFKKNTKYKFFEIDGERSIEEIQSEIMQKVF